MAGRIRSIKPELLEDEIAAGLSDAAWRLFVSSWLLADDQGGFRASPRYLAAAVWQDTGRDALSPLLELVDRGRVLLYEADGQLYATVPTWTRHQRVDNAGKPRVPKPPTNIREVSRHLAEILRDSPRLSATRRGLLGDPKTSPLDQRPPITDHDHEQRDPVFENPPPSGAGPSPGSASDPEPLAAGDLAPVHPTAEAPVPGPAGGLEPPDDTPDAPTPVAPPLEPATRQPEPPTTVFRPVPSPDAAHEAPPPESKGSEPLVLPLALSHPSPKHDPVEAIFAEYVAAWKRVIHGRRPPKLDPKRRRLTLDRLRDFAEDDLKAAARGVFASEWHVLEKQTSYELVMRDAAHVEKFMACDDATRTHPPAPPDWLSDAARPSARVMAALRGKPPPDPNAQTDILAGIENIGSIEQVL